MLVQAHMLSAHNQPSSAEQNATNVIFAHPLPTLLDSTSLLSTAWQPDNISAPRHDVLDEAYLSFHRVLILLHGLQHCLNLRTWQSITGGVLEELMTPNICDLRAHANAEYKTDCRLPWNSA